ncbi:copper chaperone PCu(A)C [Pyxidicoccus sp. 3LFB2]
MAALILALACGCAPSSEKASRASTPGVRVEGAWARLTPAQVGAVYLTLVNTAAQDDRLLGGESAAARRVELHEVIPRGEVLQMHPRPEGFLVPAEGSVELKPGSKHLMLYDVSAAPAHIDLTLRFERSPPMHLRVRVMAPDEEETP